MRYETYTEPAPSSEQVRTAFEELAPIRDDYPLVPIEQGFNWSGCADGISIPSLYLVVFRSVRRADADLETLRAYDDAAYEDASRAPGFVHYFKGQVTPERICLSFCLWRSRVEARAASARQAHSEAANVVAQMYESYKLERHMLYKRQGMLVFEQISG